MSVLSGVKQAWGGKGMGHKRRGDKDVPNVVLVFLREMGALQAQQTEPQLMSCYYTDAYLRTGCHFKF
jgi:hypothetical protein